MTDLAPEAREAPDAGTSLIDTTILGSLRQKRQKIGEGSEPLYLPVPGYEGRLILRFKWVDPKALSRTASSIRGIEDANEQMQAASADTLAAACEEVFVKVDGAELPGIPKGIAPLSTDGTPVTFKDSRLAYALGFTDPGNAREMVFLTYNNPYALIDQASTLVTWLEDTTRKVNEAFLGE